MAGEKRSKDSDEVVRAETTILLDIEGTTTSISFVKDTLFPYVRDNLKKYVAEKWDQEEFKADLEKLKEQAKKDEEAKVTGFVPISGTTSEEEKESLVKNVLWQMDEDRKTGALKQLQGHIWRQAYESGAVKGHVYEDVPKALESWTDAGRKIYIYSSGSVESQKLLFCNSQSSDLTKYLSDYFDTEVGAKEEAASYKNILSKLNVDAPSVLFLTDIVKEAQAAKEAGIAATIVVRKGNAPLSEEEKSAFSTITSFEEISFQSSSKRQKVDTCAEKKDAVAEETSKKEINGKTEVNGKSETDSKTEESPCEPMDTSEDILAETAKKPETAKPEEKESKVVVEAEQKEEEKKAEVPAEESKKSSVEDSKEKSTDAISAEPKVEPTKAEDKKDEEMVVDEPDKVAKPQEVVQKVETPVVEKTKENLPEEKKETETEKVGDSESKPVPIPESKTEDKKTPELKPETEAKSESSKKVEQPEVTEEKVEKVDKVEKVTEATEEKTAESKEEKKPEPKVEKIPEIVVEKASEVEAEKEKVPAIKENGGISKVEEAKEEKTKEAEKAKEEKTKEVEKVKEEKTKEVEKVKEEKTKEVEKAKEEKTKEVEKAKEEIKPEVQPELRSEKPEEKSEEKKEAPEKLKETEKAKEIENGKGVENGKAEVENAKAEAKEEEQKLNGTSNGEKKQSNGISEKEKSDSKSTEATSSQNGDSETTESIKIKKLVDTTVADAAAEPELVTPPVAVAASS